ncbi:Peroxidase 12 [Triticum urartu]|uniref:Peroxidase n=1 Tax=Triticum urartu TaxID=4572 RepID=M7ZC09_TRIUA|nr:Peroxidase 12 [Triticum urartu]
MASRAAAAALALVCAAHSAAAAGNLSPDFYKKACPQLDQIVAFHVAETFRRDVGVAPGLIRILFHDCFTQGCDASVLLNATDGEQKVGPNLTLRRVALDLIERIRSAVHTACKDNKVSCADITVLATREAVFKAGGPRFDVELGRRDALAPAPAQINKLPGPSFPVPLLIQSFKGRGLDVADLVALSGAHTFGVAHCSLFQDRFKPGFGNPPIDPKFATMLKDKCANDFDRKKTQSLDVRTPDAFDNQFYMDLVAKQGLFRSDQGLIEDPATKALATQFSLDQRAFFEQFAKSMTKMTNMDVLTGKQGEIRNDCAVPNKRVTAHGDEEGHAADIALHAHGCAAPATEDGRWKRGTEGRRPRNSAAPVQVLGARPDRGSLDPSSEVEADALIGAMGAGPGSAAVLPGTTGR